MTPEFLPPVVLAPARSRHDRIWPRVLAMLPLLGWLAIALPTGVLLTAGSDPCFDQTSPRICTGAGQDEVALLPVVFASAGFAVALVGCVMPRPWRACVLFGAYPIASIGFAIALQVATAPT
jgi:hypothetical protein